MLLFCPLSKTKIPQNWGFRGYNPYSGILWTNFARIFRKKVSHARWCVERHRTKMRWKVLILALQEPSVKVSVIKTSKGVQFCKKTHSAKLSRNFATLSIGEVES